MEKDSYKLPVCDCGKSLVFVEEIACYSERKLNKDGTLAKRLPKLYPVGGTELQKLECPDCGNIYDFSYDSKHRIIRNELIDYKFIKGIGSSS